MTPFRIIVVLITWWVASPGMVAFAEGELPQDKRGPRTIVVALDGSGEFRSIQAALDVAGKGDTIQVKAGAYPEDVTIHSKEDLKLIGEGIDQVTILGKDRVGVLHIGKWPYGATNIEISGMTINEHGGHAMGIFNGKGLVLHDLKVKGMLFGQQVQDVRIERCRIGGSETTGVQFADSQAVLIGNVIHDNDHGVNIAGKSVVRLERNLIIRQLFEAVVVTDHARAIVIANTLVRNGGAAAFLARSQSEVSGNIVSRNKVGFAVAPTSDVRFTHNAFSETGEHYVRPGSPEVPAPELGNGSDFTGDPGFLDPSRDDFRLRNDSSLLKVRDFSYLGALDPAPPDR
ncbi:MAG: pectinesterase family protein [Nitrospiraceae bacterium]